MLQITTSADESRLYILDMAAPHVTMLDARDGSYMDQFGRSGEGPGEFIQPERITIAHDGHLLIPDSRRRVIHVFAEDGHFVRAIPVGNVGPVDVVAADSGFFWIHAGTPAAIATLYDGEGDRLRDAGVFSREIPAGMGKNGYLLRHPNRPSMFYVGRFGGRLSKFTLEGDLRFHRQTIDPNDYPAPVALSGGESFTMDQSNVHALRALAGVTDEGVYVGIIQTVEEPSSGLRFLVDRYDPETGDYLYSHDSPNPDCTIVQMTTAHAYTHCPLDSSIERWRRVPDQPEAARALEVSLRGSMEGKETRRRRGTASLYGGVGVFFRDEDSRRRRNEVQRWRTSIQNSALFSRRCSASAPTDGRFPSEV